MLISTVCGAYSGKSDTLKIKRSLFPIREISFKKTLKQPPFAPGAVFGGLGNLGFCVFMVTPNTAEERAAAIAQHTTGFIYTVSTLGVTGERAKLSNTVKPLITRLKALTDVPICVGFGISTPQQAAEVAKAGADGVIIGSRIVKIIEQNPNNKQKIKEELTNFIKSVRTALG